MYLKRLEIQGFKSFPEKTKLDFTKGITTVVGPNGSGKSNISDAVRWALGEQSAKTLRGGKMEDVIFAGTQNRRALQFAEVSLILNNEDKKIYIEFDEIKVTRRVYRSGEGEYSLNGVNCRLKDIHELFMDTGVGKEGYSIIGQGKIDEILSAKSNDRRLLFEEAAGIVKYKNRKIEAENKLEKEKQNLTRVDDIINEIALQLESLKEQSETAKRFLSLSERLKLVQINIFLNESAGSEEKITSLSDKVESLKQTINDNSEKKEEFKNNLFNLKEKYDEQIKIYKKSGDELNSFRLEIEKKENDINLFNEKISHIEKDTFRINTDIKKKENDISAKFSVKESFIKHRDSLILKLDEFKNTLLQYQSDFDILSNELMESENKLNAYTQKIYEKMTEISGKKNEHEKQNVNYLQFELKKEQLIEESNINSQRLTDCAEKKKTLENKLESIKSETIEIKNKLMFYEDEITALYKAEKDKSEEYNEILKKYNSKKARLKLLKELEDSYEGYYKSVKAILAYKKDNPEKFKGVLGAVGSLLSVPSGYEIAIETALGGYIQNLVTQTEYDTKEAISYLKEYKLGRATFLPLNAINPKDIGQIRTKLSLEPGFAGIAKELISYDEKYENIFSNILGRVIIVNNFNDALKMFKKYNYAYKIVTMEGELLNAGGAITGGAQESSGTKIFGRSREIAALTSETEELRCVSVKYAELLETIKTKEQNAKSKSIALREELQKININSTTISQEIIVTNSTIEELFNRQEAIKKEDSEIINEIIQTNKNIRDINVEINSCEHELTEIKESMKLYQKELAESREEKDVKIKLLTDLKIEIASINEKLQSTEDNIKRLDEESKARLVEIEKSKFEIENILFNKKSLEESIKNCAAEIEALKHKCIEKELCLSESEKLNIEYSESITEFETAADEITQTVSNLNNELTRQTFKLEQAQDEIKRLYDLMWDEYEITYNTAKQYEKIEKSTKELQSEERAIKGNIKALGNVYVGAIEEYKEKKERYDFLTLQKSDILEAEESLNKLIKELTSLMEEQFREQLTVISYNFNIVFSEMFGGGSAGLMLTDKDNILESGIELIAQPPGKKLQIMSLLSGGERSLTAMALLFAILRMKPSPFCVLDEIDAALDDANVVRFTNYLKNFSHETQFILISHKKGTMVAADALYGVTMQEQGVSKLVSVNLKEA